MPIHTPLHEYTESEVTGLIEANAVESTLTWGVWDRIEVRKEEDCVSTFTSNPFPFFNGIMSPRFTADSADGRIADFVNTARDRGVGMSWWLGSDYSPEDLPTRLDAAGFIQAGEPAGMAIDLSELSDATLLEEKSVIVEVTCPEELEYWNEIVAEVNEFPEPAASAWLEMFQAIGLEGANGWRHYLALLDGERVGASSLYAGSEVASIASVSVLEPYRNRGVGAAVSLFPFLVARDMGYGIGTLWASEMGEPVYRRMGFQRYCSSPVYIFEA